MSDSAPLPTLVVGVGASLGGLEAFRELLPVLPTDEGMAFLLVQHLLPGQESRLAELLEASTSMPVHEARAGATIEPNAVYVAPPGVALGVDEGRLTLDEPELRDGRRSTVDHLFRSIAAAYGPRAVGMVLSGAGRDGSAGVRPLKAAGGLVIAQDPRSTRSPGMPRSAIGTGCVDRVVAPDEVHAILVRFANLPLDMRQPVADAPPPSPDGPLDEATLARLTAILASSAGFELSAYKPSIVARRVRRRQALSSHDDLDSWVEAFADDPGEQRRLVGDMLIGVTEFFRGPEAFEQLRTRFVEPVTRELPRGATVRIWVPGCATGEEAYSIGMLMLDALGASGGPSQVQIFATDLDPEAIAFARAGVFPEASVPPEESVRSHFESLPGRGLRVRTRLRDIVSFAVHDLRADPPFSNIDLVSCRNVLIYLGPEAQQDVLRAFHFSLKPEGMLFLGLAETPAAEPGLFEEISMEDRLFRRAGVARRARTTPTRARVPKPSAVPDVDEVAEEARSALLASWVPPSVLVGTDDVVRYIHGELAPYLRFPEGNDPRLDLRLLLRPNIETRARGVLHRCRTEREPATAIADGAEPGTRVRLTARPLSDPEEGPFDVMLSFEPLSPETVAASPEPVPRVEVLERELEAVQEDLRNTVDELESSNEELRSANEEARSMNEELRSANEELEATSEELRALNEELTTLNDQLREKIAEVEQAHADLRNFTESTRVAALFLDDQLRVRRFTPAARTLLHIDHADVGQAFLEVPRQLFEEGLESDCLAVLDDFVPRQTEVELQDGRSFQRQVMPYRTESRTVEGVVVTFMDVTEHKAIEAALRKSERAFREMADRLPILVWVHDESGRQEFVNQTYCDYFGVTREEMTGGRWQMLVHPEDAAGYNGEFLDCVRERRSFHAEARVRRGDGAWRRVESWARLRVDEDGAFRGFVGSTVDVTERREAEEALRESEVRFRALADNISQLAWMAEPDGRRTWSNLRWVHFTGTPAEDSDDFGWERFVHPDHLERVREGYRAAFAAQEPWEEIFPMRRADRAYRWFLVRASPLRDESGRVFRYVGTHTDITERREAEQLLEEADRQKNDFLAMLGHELRNPLAAVRSATEVLQRESHRPGAQHALDVVQRQTRQMTRLIDGLLDISRIARQKITLERERLDLGGLARGVVQDSHSRYVGAEERAITVRTPDEPVWVDGDRVRLTQVAENLVSNAIKFTDPGDTNEVGVVTTATRAHLTVRDSGIGIEDELLSEIFEPFRQSRRTMDRDRRGLGLGLSLVRAIAELHGGRATASSPGPGEGTELVVEIPLGSAPSSSRRRSAPARPERQSIVLIEDQTDVAEMLQEVLELEGHEVALAPDGEGGLELVRRIRPDAVLCDLSLQGDKNGLDVARELRADPETAEIMLVAVTGYGQSEDASRSLDAGFDAHLTKPIEMAELLAVLAASPQEG